MPEQDTEVDDNFFATQSISVTAIEGKEKFVKSSSGKIEEGVIECDVTHCHRPSFHHAVNLQNGIKMNLCKRCYFSFNIAANSSQVDELVLGNLYDLFRGDIATMLKYISSIADFSLKNRDLLYVMIDETPTGEVDDGLKGDSKSEGSSDASSGGEGGIESGSSVESGTDADAGESHDATDS